MKLLTSTQGDSYQRFYNGDTIQGANDQTYIPTENGIYTVSTIAFNGCSNSNNYTIQNLGIESNKNFSYSIYPNPTNGHFNIVSSKNINVAIYNTLGQTIFQSQNHQFLKIKS